MRRKSGRLVRVTAWLMTGWLMTGLPGCGMDSDEGAESFSSIPDTEWGEPVQEVREGDVSGSAGKESPREAEGEDRGTSATGDESMSTSAASKDESTSASAMSEDGGTSASAASEDGSMSASATSEDGSMRSSAESEDEGMSTSTELEDENKCTSAESEDGNASTSVASEDESMRGSAASEDESTRNFAMPEDGNTSTSAASEEASPEGNLTFTLGSGLPDLPAEVKEQVDALNEGKPPGSVIDSEELEGCYALIATHMIIATDKETGEESTGKGRLTFYVPNLLEGLEGVAALFYNREAGAWEILTPAQINTEAKTVSVNLTGSGILTVIYRRE